MKPSKVPIVLAVLLVASALAGCVGDDASSPAQVHVAVANEPADGAAEWSSFEVTFHSVKVHEDADAQPGDEGWRTIVETSRTVDLLEVGGNGTGGVLGSGAVPGGSYGAVLLTVTAAQATPVNGSAPVDLPVRGKLLVPAEVRFTSGNLTELVLDVDLQRDGALQPVEGEDAPRYTPYLDRIVLRRPTPDGDEAPSPPANTSSPDAPTPEGPVVPEDPWTGGDATPEPRGREAERRPADAVPRDSWQLVDPTGGSDDASEQEPEEPEPTEPPEPPEPPAEEPEANPPSQEDDGTSGAGTNSSAGEDEGAVQRGVVVVTEDRDDEDEVHEGGSSSGDGPRVVEDAEDVEEEQDEEESEGDEEESEGDEEESEGDEEDGEEDGTKKSPNGTTSSGSQDGGMNGTQGNTTDGGSEDGGTDPQDGQEDQSGDEDTDGDGNGTGSSDSTDDGSGDTTSGSDDGNTTSDGGDGDATGSSGNETGYGSSDDGSDGNTTGYGSSDDGNTTAYAAWDGPGAWARNLWDRADADALAVRPF